VGLLEVLDAQRTYSHDKYWVQGIQTSELMEAAVSTADVRPRTVA